MQTHMRLLTRWFTGVVLVAFVGSTALCAAETPKPPSPLIGALDLLKIKQLDDPVFSPDGQSIIYTAKGIVDKPDKPGEYNYETHLWLASADGHAAPRQLTHGEAGGSSPQWSPDGRRVAFVRKGKDKPQIWILPVADGGEAFAVTKLETGASNPRWSPDGKLIAFVSTLNTTAIRKELEKIHAPSAQPDWTVEKPNRAAGDVGDWFDKDKEAKKPHADPDGTRQEQREWLAKNEADGNPRVIDRLNFLGESDLEPHPEFKNLFVVEAVEGAEPRNLTPGYRSAEAPSWSPDSRQIVFAVDPKTDRDPDREFANDLDVVNADGTGRAPFLSDPNQNFGEPEFSPDGKTIAFLAQNVVKDPGYAQTFVGFKRVGSSAAPWYADSLDRSAGNLHWSADSARVYFTAASSGGFPLYRVSAQEKSKPERLTGTDTGVGGFDVANDKIAYVLTKPADPYELYVAKADAQEPRILTTHNSEWLREKQVSLPEHRTITSPDNTVVDVWLIKPAAFDAGKKYPLLLEIHGGPQAMWGPGEASMWHEFQYFASHGYGVVYCNPRGSGGYGFNFQHGNYQNWGPGPGADILAAADLAAKEPWVDVDRQVVTGGSYGGYMTAWIVSHDHRFKAAVAVRGVYDLATFFGEGNAWRLVPFHFGGYPWQKDIAEILRANSPMTFVQDITTPLLIKHGDTDFRTGVVQSQMLYKSLKILGRPVEYARYPHATHELSRSGDPRQRLDRIVRFDEFFRRYIGEN
ncbi:MAG: peptidase [Verrucomicrobia bacterium]|nr:peptidase [Verrucomicrobiota bacterium]